jgi:predicted nucleic acid-binding protein
LILKAVEQRKVNVVWSFVLDLENDQNPFEARRAEVAWWKKFAMKFIAPNSEVQAQAEDLAAAGFKPLDALHLGCAIVSKAAYFITVDDGILRKKGRVKELAAMLPLEFVQAFGAQL